ncbi:YchJ family protein [uncultured Psychrobacter sp.]|uniref:YchJ family protein n=1 Tax=uncultured Psychrobacter sp. TaxID=259303 RepID=UPI0025957D68|nr:YchJ family protein [uncultured Psychrobacter sp.]
MSLSLPICPCQINPVSDAIGAPLLYQDCCQPYHDGLLNKEADGIKAETAKRLMRTRYSAFVLVKPNYIVKTTIPAQQNLLDIKAIENWAKETDWAGLEIVTHTPKLDKRHAQVEFKAYFKTNENLQAHHELSAFVKVTDKNSNNARWYFLDPTVSMSVSQKQPCICGSGEKFKRCCGAYI